MASVTLWETPAPSSGFFEGVALRILPKRTVCLQFQYEDKAGRSHSSEIRFLDTAAFRCHYRMALTPEMINSSYDQLIDVGASPWLKEVNDLVRGEGLKVNLRHLRICFDDGPCYEALCAGFEIVTPE